MSQRTLQIASVLQRNVQSLLSRGLNDPRISGLVSVTKVNVAEDLANATIFVSITPEDRVALTMHGLRSATSHIQSKLNRSLPLKKVPKISFREDRSIKKEAEVLAAIARANESTAPSSDTDVDEHQPDQNTEETAT